MTRRRTAKAQSAEGGACGPTTRLGPRPLPLHLATAVSTWMSSLAALPLLRDGSLTWRPGLQSEAEALRASLANTAAEDFEGAVDGEIRRRLDAFLGAIETYRRHPYRRHTTTPESLWQQGTTRLLDYADPGATGPGVPILLIPSLINRAYILDLNRENSLVRWLAARGFRPFLIDWQRPAEEERGFGLTDYIAGRLEPALDAVRRETGRKPFLLGYCMGGLLALALAARRQSDVSGMALLATPWDFHADGPEQGQLAAATLPAMAPLLELLGEMPVDAIQALFAALDPQMVLRKFLAFARLDPASPKAAAFVALEDWLNDGVPLSGPVARECLLEWYGENRTARGTWRVAGKPVEPVEIALPSLCVIPAQDRIVPPASARALAKRIPGCRRLTPAVGHIGMVVSGRAKNAVWAPLLTWLKEHCSTTA